MRKLLTATAMIALAATAACNRSGGSNNVNASQSNGAAATSPANSAGANAAAPSAATGEAEVRALLDQIYAPYANEDMPGRDIEVFFAPEIVKAITAEEGGIDVDPFIDAQDWAPFRPNIQRVTMSGNDRAEASVNFTSMGTSKTLIYQLVRTAAGWKVADIRSGTGNLRSKFNLPPLP
jgi:hypothetical protein